jgi:hypothetical protein
VNPLSKSFLLGACLFLGMQQVTRAGTATAVTGLYFTGIKDDGSLASSGPDSHWAINYASTNGGATRNTYYQGAAYVVGNNENFSAWTDVANAQWIVPPNATAVTTYITGSPASTGYDAVPGNGTGNKEGVYVYTLAFQIVGTGNIGDRVTNSVSISLTLAGDDLYSVYVNPAGNGTTLPTGGSAGGTWSQTSTVTLQNGTNGSGLSGNSIFKIGTNYLTVVVSNTNGSNNKNEQNPSGLLVYQTGTATLIDGRPNPVPEVGAWLPVIGALGLFVRQRRKSSTARPRKIVAQ